MKHIFYKSTLLMAAVLTAVAGWAAEPALTLGGGSGTADDPYIISKAEHIVELANACNGTATTASADLGHYAGKYFVMTQNIDMGNVTDFYGIATAPMGKSSGSTWKFKGNFDGLGNTISNLNINGLVENAAGTGLATGKDGSRNYVGLFGYIEDAVVKNVNLDETCVIKGRQYVGGIAGYMSGTTTTSNPVTTIENCHVAATIEGYYSYTGGIVGQASGGNVTRVKHIKNCWMSGSVSSDNSTAGGIAGQITYTEISKCIVTGTVTLRRIKYASATTSQRYGGGIVGTMNATSTVDNCFTCGKVDVRTDYAGGVAGSMGSSSAVVKNTVCLSPVICRFDPSGTTIYHGVITGRFYNGATLENVYYDRQMWGDRVCDQGVVANIGQANDLLTSGAALPGLDTDFWVFAKGFYPIPAGESEDYTKPAAGVYLKFPGTTMASDFGSQATVSTALPGITVALAAEAAPFTVANGVISCPDVTQIAQTTATLTLGDYSIDVPLTKLPKLFQGEGTAESPYIIATKTDLLNMTVMTNSELAEHYNDVYFKQTADIDLEGEEFPGIASVFTKTSNPYAVYYFSGNYDGGNYAIKNMTVNGAKFDANGKCLSPTVTDGSKNAVGMFGTLGNGARIANIRLINPKVNGYNYIGGIAGYTLEDTHIVNCRVENAVIDCYYSYGGGVVGYAVSTSKSTRNQITNCGFSGSVRAGYNDVGGIAGSSQAIITGCVNTGAVTCEVFNAVVTNHTQQKNVGGIVGYNMGSIINSANYGPVYGEVGVTGGLAGYSTASSGRGTITAGMNFGTVYTEDTQTAGALIGSEASSASTPPTIENNFYDEQYVAYGANENGALDGVTPAKTAALTNGQPLPGLDTIYTFTAGYYPIPTPMADWTPAKVAAATYMLMPTGSLSNFSKGTLASTMPLTATLEQPEGSTAFKLEGNTLTVNATEMCTATLTINNGTYSRALKLQAVPSVLPGTGTQDDPYIIASADDFNKIGQYNHDAGQSFEDAYFKVTADLDFTGKTLTSPGSTGLSFKGIIDGQNHTVKNLTMTDEAGDPLGLVADLGYGGKLSNLTFTACTVTGIFKCGVATGICSGTIENITVDATCSVTLAKKDALKNGTYGGGMTGMLMPTGVITNCHNKAPVTALKNVGGIFGACDATLGAVVYGCTNAGAIHCTAPMEYDDSGSKLAPTGLAGGIGGSLSGTITKCSNTGKITSDYAHALGGITGMMSAAGSMIDSCENHGVIEGANRYAAGICGDSKAGKEAQYSVIKNCANHGRVTAALNTQSPSVTAGGYSGGIVGRLTGYNQVLNCVNYSLINTKGFYVAGIAGNTTGIGVLVDNCYNVGDISAGAYVGGIVGQGAMGTEINNCFNVGNIASTQEGYGCAGGIGNLSAINSGPASSRNCYNMGNVQAEKVAGGVFGQCRTATINHCYNTGVAFVTKPENEASAGNILAEITTNTITVVDSCYWLNTLQTLPMDDPEKHIDGQSFNMRAVAAADLFNGQSLLGNGFVYTPYCFPRINTLADKDFAKLFAVYYQLADSDTPASINHSFPLGMIDGVIWVATGSLTVRDANGQLRAYPNSKGQAMLMACYGDYTRSFSFTTTTGVTGADAGIDVVSTVYYGMDGTRLANPEKGSTVIRIQTLSDGTTRTEKVVIR